jgi:thiosulfate sulfurtransferase
MKYKHLPVVDVEKLLQEAAPIILDCRNVKDYQAGHLDNALHVHEGLKASLVKRGDKQRSLLIYCYHGHASEHLAELFADFGFIDVYSLVGGYTLYTEYKSQLENQY